MIVDFIDFKTVNLNSKLDTSIGAELALSQEGKASAKVPDEWSGYAVIYLNIKIHDQDDTYFVFDITTETIIKLPDEVKEFTEEAMEAISHTTLENALGYEKGEIPTGNQV